MNKHAIAAASPIVHMIGHAHLDPVWLWTWTEGLQEARATFRSALDRMDEYSDFVFTMDQIVLLSWVEETEPELFARIRERVREGRWQITGGWWVEPDTNVVLGESLVRQGLAGQRYLHDRFGVLATVGMNADSFGHSRMLPQILRGQRIDSYVFLRPEPHELALPASLFSWESPDGSSVRAYRIPHRYWSPDEDVSTQLDAARELITSASDHAMVFYGVGNHGGGPTRRHLDSIVALRDTEALRLSSPRDFFDAVEPDLELPVWRGDLQHHARGCYSAHSGVKRWMQDAELALLRAERWTATSALLGEGTARAAQLVSDAWRSVLFNQFHDILPGTAVESAYEDARHELGGAIATARSVEVRAQAMIARRVHVPYEESTQPFLVFNPRTVKASEVVHVQFESAGNEVSGVIVDAEGRVVPSQPTSPDSVTRGDSDRRALVFTAEVPALGYRLYRVRRLESPAIDIRSSVRASATEVETDRLRVELDAATGWIRRIEVRSTGAVIDFDAQPHAVVIADPSDTWGHGVVGFGGPGEGMAVESFALVESGPVRAVYRATRRLRKSTLTEDIIVDAGTDQIRVRAILDWREPLHLLELVLAPRLTRSRFWTDVPFSVIDRPADGSEHPMVTWALLSEDAEQVAPDAQRRGVALVAQGKHGVHAEWFDGVGRLAVTAVRSPAYAWHAPAGFNPGPATAFQDIGIQSFDYLVVPAGDEGSPGALHDASERLLNPVTPVHESAHEGDLPAQGTFIGCESADALVSAIKVAEDFADRIVVRLWETSGSSRTVKLELPIAGRSIPVHLDAHEIKTLRISLHEPRAIEVVDLLEWAKEEGETYYV